MFVAGILVLFMQAGFAMLEIGFSRSKNAGTVMGKILINLSIAAICSGRSASPSPSARATTSSVRAAGSWPAPTSANFPLVNVAPIQARSRRDAWFFQLVFCAVSLAIVWGTTLERIKFGVYIIFAIVFSALIYPIGAHWIFGGGWLATQSACRTSPARRSST